MWRALLGPGRGGPFGCPVWEQVAGGRGWEQGARGAALSPVQIWGGCPSSPLGAWPKAVPCHHLALSSQLTKVIFSGTKWEMLGSIPVFSASIREWKGKQHNKIPSLSATDPKGEHQAKGEEGAGQAWQVFPPTEDPPQVLERDPLPADPSPYTLRAGQEPLLGSFSPRWHRKPRHCACLSTPSHSSP